MRQLSCYIATLLAVLVLCTSPAIALPPDLEDAYWRFEEGADEVAVAPGSDVVEDSANSNHMRAFNADTAPTYTSAVAPFPLRSGDANNLALDFATHPGGGDDLFTVSKPINEGLIPDGGGFTLEAAFRPDVVGGPFQAIVAKEGRPAGNLPTLALKVRGDNGNLHFEQYDKAGNLVGVQSASSLIGGQWYAAAAVNDGQTLSLYLRGETDLDYVLQGSVAVNGALYQGNDDWNYAWTIGRAVFGGPNPGHPGNPADWYDGLIDEVRLTARALDPSEFLFRPIPEPQSIALAAMALAGLAWRRIARPRRD